MKHYDHNGMNEQLRGLYENALRDWAPKLTRATDLSLPHFLKVPEDYGRTAIKLMIVGQETHGWRKWDPAAVIPRVLDDTLNKYDEFALANDKKKRRSPFWQAAYKIYGALNPQGPERAFLWSNLVKVDQRKHRPQLEVEEAVSNFPVLRTELRITQPDVVVFFTGPHYDGRLNSLFEEVTRESVEPAKNGHLLVRLVHKALPKLAYRTYHPHYLRRQGRWCVLDELLADARNHFASR